MTISYPNTIFARVLELAVVLLLSYYGEKWVVEAAAALHFPLPELPLLKHVYVSFAFVLLVCLWIRLRGEPFSEFGLIVPTHWWRYIGQGVLIVVAVMLWDALLWPLIAPILVQATGTSATLAEQHFAPLRGNLGLLLYIVPFTWVCAGFGEEMLFRGFIMTRFAQILGGGRWAWIAAMFLQAIPFALGHGYQGPVGMVHVYVGGVIVGAGSMIFGRRNLWPVIIAHGLQDTIGFIALYAGVAQG